MAWRETGDRDSGRISESIWTRTVSVWLGVDIDKLSLKPQAYDGIYFDNWLEHIKAETKWPPFRRRHIQMHFHENV